MTKKTIIAAVCVAAALFANGAAKWKNLDDKFHVSGPKLTEADLLGKAVLVYYWDASKEASVKYLPEVEKVWSSFKTKKFQVVGNYVGTKNDEKVKELVQKNKVTLSGSRLSRGSVFQRRKPQGRQRPRQGKRKGGD